MSRGLNVEVKDDKKHPTIPHPDDIQPSQRTVRTKQGRSVWFLLRIRGNSRSLEGELDVRELKIVSETFRSWTSDHNFEKGLKNLTGKHEKILRKQRVINTSESERLSSATAAFGKLKGRAKH